jgi:NADPH2:quinone reductase
LGLIYPSESWETFGLVVAEAFEAGVPVVARAGSAGADLVEQFQAGAVYGPGHQSLREALDYVSANQEILRQRARVAYEQNFTELFDMYTAGKIKPIVTESFAFKDYVAAFSVFRDRKVMGKVTMEIRAE